MIKTACIAIAKNETPYLDEWITYYHNMGFDDIYIWDNNDVGDNSIYQFASRYPYVTILDVRGRDALINHGMQKGCYQETYNSIQARYDWIGIFDIDEFLYLPTDIENFVSNSMFADAGCIHFNWRYYGDNDLVFNDGRPVQERFTKPCIDTVKYNSAIPHENAWVKSLIRGKCSDMQILVHSAYHKKLLCRHATGTVENGLSELSPKIDFSNGYVKHYGTKTITEYIERKCWNVQNACDKNFISACTRLDWFFNVNKHTPIKDKIAKFFYDRGI